MVEKKKGAENNTNDLATNQSKDNKDFKTVNDIQQEIDEKFNSNTKVVKSNGEEETEHPQTIFHIVESYLSKHYELRLNKIMLDIEIKEKNIDSKWRICNENDLYIEMQKKNIKVSRDKLNAILGSSFVPEYNPILNYFNRLKKWDGIDYISILCKYIESPDIEQFEYHLKKWLVRSVKCMLIDGYFNKQAFIITDKGKGQNIGKSHFTKWLCPPGLPVTRSFEENKKDNLIKLTKNAFIILDELDGISRKDLNSLKSMFSTDETRVRLPFAKREETIQRITNFIGSTNDDTFLSDPTGSVRWLVFHVTSINWNYSKDIDINNIWSQAYSLSKDDRFEEKLIKEDLANNEKRNEQYQVRSNEQELIETFFDKPNEENRKSVQFFTATDIQRTLQASFGQKLYVVSIGKAMKQLKFERVKHKDRYGYWVVYNDKSTPIR
ncbi:VapE domain-containing protein [Winogradskyella sp. ECml5-4]|uniref:VapE domain-containing protein n=1 Tax=Winogradskyella sp. ECml5-4 TaxID=3110975 RepID=UPI002FF19A0F